MISSMMSLFSSTLVMRKTCDISLYNGMYITLSYDVAPESEITPGIKMDKPLVVYRFSGNVITSMTKLGT